MLLLVSHDVPGPVDDPGLREVMPPCDRKSTPGGAEKVTSIRRQVLWGTGYCEQPANGFTRRRTIMPKRALVLIDGYVVCDTSNFDEAAEMLHRRVNEG